MARKKDLEIAPEDIFLDVSNVPSFDRARFEGRIEKPLARGAHVSLALALILLFMIIVARAGNLQLTQGAAFAAQSARNSLEVETLFAPRGVITDKHGEVLAENVVTEEGVIRRSYSLPALGQILGYVSFPKKDASGVYYQTAEIGQAGLEAMYNELLTGTNGQLLTETDAVGTVRSQGTMVRAVEGSPLTLTIDAELERLFAHAIADTAKRTGFIAGAGVILDVHTGTVEAIVSYPTYDSNIMSNGGPAATIAAYTSDSGHPFLDHAVQGIYAPGSTVKPFVSAGALTDGLITPGTIIDDPGSISVPDPYHPGKSFVYKGWKPLGLMDVRKAIAWSSDIFFYTVGGGFKGQKGLGINRLGYWYRQFGIGSKTGIDLPDEAAGLVPTPEWKLKTFNEPWYTGDTYFTAIGQYSMQVTPVQMVRAIAAIANGGRLYRPMLVAGREPSYTKVSVAADALQVVREGMRMGVTSAVASAVNFPFLSVAAKTGTAETGTRNQYINSWLVGFFPYENPKYAFAVVLERGPANAGSQALNVMRDLFNALHAAGSPYVDGTGTTTTP